MVTNDGDQGGPSRRDFLKAGGVGALTMAVAGCEGLPEDGEDGGSGNETDGGGPGTGTPGGDGGGPGTGTPGGDGGGGNWDDPFVARPASIVEEFAQEAEDDLARGTFLDERYTRIEGGIPGFDVPDEVTPVGHGVTYGHDMQLPGDDDGGPATLNALSAGILSLPNPDVEGAPANPYAERSLSELVSAREENLPLAAAGLGPTVEWLSDPVSIEQTEVEVESVGGTMTVETFVGPVSAEPGRGMPDPAADGYLDDGATAPGPMMMTMHTARGVVGGSVVIVGMINGWRRPPTMGPPPTEIGPEMADLLADIYQKIVRTELFLRALDEGVRLWAELACNLDEMGPSPEDVERTVEYSDYYGLRPEARVRFGYPDEERSSPGTHASKLVGRTAPGVFDCESYDPEEHDPGEWVNLSIEQRVTAYTIDEDGAVPFGVIASPRAELEGEEQNPLVAGSLTPSSWVFDGVWQLVDEMVPFEDVDWGYSDPTEVESFPQLHIEGRDTEAKGFEGTVEYVPEGENASQEASAYLYLARLTTANEVVVACAFSMGAGDDGFFGTQEATSQVFRQAAGNVVLEPADVSEWVDGSTDPTPVQICRDTRLETAGGDVLGRSDPPLANGRNTALPFDVSTFDGTAHSGKKLPYGVFSLDVLNRPLRLGQTVLDEGDVDDLDTDTKDPDVLFDQNRDDNDANNDLPVFALQSDYAGVTLTFQAPSGYVHDTTTLVKNDDYETTGFDVLRVGFIAIVDPERGANYGDGSGRPVDYEESVEGAVEYLKRTYPTGIAAYRHDGAIEGVKDVTGNATNNTTKDYRNARVALERIAKPGNNNWNYSGTTMAHGISESDARSQIRSNGFDVWVLIPPNGYYQFHRNSNTLAGLAPQDNDLAVTTIEGDQFGRTTASEVVAQEIGHRLEDDPYQNPGSGNGESNPLAQRDDDGTDTANRDFDHARHLSSDNDGSTPTDGPGLVSRAYSLVDGEFVVPARNVWDGGFDVQPLDDYGSNNNDYGTYGPTGDATRVGRVESYMSYVSGRSVWADSTITRDIVESGLNRDSGNFRTANVLLGGLNDVNLAVSGAEPGAVPTEGPVLTGLESQRDASPRSNEALLAEADEVVEVVMLGPDGTTVAEAQAPAVGGIDGHEVDGETLAGDTPFRVGFPPDAVEMVVVDESGELRANPITRPIRDAYATLPESAHGTAFDREELGTLLEGVDAEMSAGNFAKARDALATFAEQDLAGTIDPEFDPAANQYDEARMRALFDEMIGRLDGLASGGSGDDEIKVGETGSWTDWVPEPSALPVFADSRGLWQYDAASVLESGGIDEKVALEDPMANPFLAGFFATAFWQQLGALGLGEAVVGPAVTRTDVDPAEVPLETGAFFGNVQLYLGDFSVDELDTAVSEGPFSESDTAGVYVHDESEFAVAYDATYVVLASTVDEVVTILETGAGQRDRWYEVNDEVKWLYEAGATGEFSVVVHRESGTIPDESDDRATFSPFTAANGLAQSAWLDGETFTRARTALVYPSEDAVELSVLRETLGMDAVDRSIDQNGRFVQVQATYSG